MEFLFAQFSKIKDNYLVLLITILLIVINDVILLKCINCINSNHETIINKAVETNSTSLNQPFDQLYVDVKGEVKKPGVYQVDSSMIVNDVIKLAGGLKKSASTENINLSKKVTDQMVIIISSKSKLKKKIDNNLVVIKNDALIKNEQSNTTNDNNDFTINNNSSNLVNINIASIDELMQISGVGKSKAEAIISYREKEKFSSIEDIKKVTGIGDSLFEKIKIYITV